MSETTTAAKPTKIAFTQKLVAPILHHRKGEEVSELSFREPTGSDIINHGIPVVWDLFQTPPKPDFDAKRMADMLASLADVLPITIRSLHPTDFMACAWGVVPFFLPNMFGES